MIKSAYDGLSNDKLMGDDNMFGEEYENSLPVANNEKLNDILVATTDKNKIVLSSSEFTLTPEELLWIETDLKLEKQRKIFVHILDKCIEELVLIKDDKSEILVKFEADKSPGVTIKGTPGVRWGVETEMTDLCITKDIFYTYSGKRKDLLRFLYSYRDTVLNYGKNITFHTEVAE